MYPVAGRVSGYPPGYFNKVVVVAAHHQRFHAVPSPFHHVRRRLGHTGTVQQRTHSPPHLDRPSVIKLKEEERPTHSCHMVVHARVLHGLVLVWVAKGRQAHLFQCLTDGFE